MYIKPKTGLRIRDPDMQDFLPDEGREIQSSSYWSRRLRDGDVIELKTKPKQIKDKK